MLLDACSKTEYTALTSDAVILAFGDSLTAGYGTSRDNSYPAHLQHLTGLTVVNAGVSGETTSEGLMRLPALLTQYEPELVILIEGGNDILRNLSASRAKKNLAAMIELSEERGAKVVLLGVPEKNLFSKTAPFYKELAEEYSVVFSPDILSDILKSPSLKSDQVHLNALGYRQMAEEVYKLLDDAGLVR